jgi:hypothetical protein
MMARLAAAMSRKAAAPGPRCMQLRRLAAPII